MGSTLTMRIVIITGIVQAIGIGALIQLLPK